VGYFSSTVGLNKAQVSRDIVSGKINRTSPRLLIFSITKQRTLKKVFSYHKKETPGGSIAGTRGRGYFKK